MNLRVGDLVKFIAAANENTPGFWKAGRKAGLVVERFLLAGKLWYLVRFGDDIVRVFHKDLELIHEGR